MLFFGLAKKLNAFSVIGSCNTAIYHCDYDINDGGTQNSNGNPNIMINQSIDSYYWAHLTGFNASLSVRDTLGSRAIIGGRLCIAPYGGTGDCSQFNFKGNGDFGSMYVGGDPNYHVVTLEYTVGNAAPNGTTSWTMTGHAKCDIGCVDEGVPNNPPPNANAPPPPPPPPPNPNLPPPPPPGGGNPPGGGGGCIPNGQGCGGNPSACCSGICPVIRGAVDVCASGGGSAPPPPISGGGPPGLTCNVNAGSFAVGGYEYPGQGGDRAFDGITETYYSGFISDGSRGIPYIARVYSGGVSVRRIIALGTSSATFNGPIQYSDDGSIWTGTGYSFAVPRESSTQTTVDLPYLGSHTYWRVLDSQDDSYHSIAELKFYDCLAPAPTVTISANPTAVGYNSASTITWSSTNTTSCSVPGIGSGVSGSGSTGGLTSNQTYTATCTGTDGSSKSASTSVTVNSPSVSISANPTQIAFRGSSTITWSSSNAGSCNASGDWSGGKATSDSQSTGALNQVKTYIYTLTCSGNGSASNTASVTVTAPVPNDPSNVTATQPNYCVSGPAATINWTYSDPTGSPQSAYQVQVDDQGSFGSPEVDSGKVNSGSTSYFTGQGVLQFNTTYRARVRVWNNYNQVSGWTTSSNFKTPNYAYPQVDFNWVANGIVNNPSPPLNKPVQFTDTTVFGNPSNRKWDWLFGDGGSSTLQNPSNVYVSEGSYYVTLTATDNANQVCVRTKGPLIIQKPIPKWREIAPK